jgi:thioredoxin-related protein
LFINAKKGTPFIYKALSQNFEKTLQFGLVRESEDALASKYKVKKFPALFVVKSEGKPLKFEGADFSYSEIFEFLNVHSQIFIDPNAKDNAPK